MKEMIGEVDGREMSISWSTKVIELSPDHFSVYSGSKNTEIFLAPSGSLSNGNSIDGIEVKGESEKERIVRERFAEYEASSSLKNPTKGRILKASMPGMVKSISVSIGDKVLKNTQVLVLEAMKMENSITAGFAGLVTKIHIEPGMSVEKSTPLIEFKQEE